MKIGASDWSSYLGILRKIHLMRNGRPVHRFHDNEVKKLTANTIPKTTKEARKFAVKLFQGSIPIV